MNIGVLTSPDTNGAQLHETQRYVEEIGELGHTPVVVNYLETAIGVTETGTLLYTMDDEDVDNPFKPVDIDVVIPNIDGHDGHVAEGVLALRALLANNLPSTHQPDSILKANHKFVSHLLFDAAGIPTPYSVMPLTRLPRRSSDLLRMVEEDPDRRIVVKSTEGTEGKGVMIQGGRKEARTVVTGLNMRNHPFFVQEYVEQSQDERVHSDIRLIVVNGELIASMQRSRCEDGDGEDEGGLLTGLSSGGKGEVYEPTSRETELALRASKALDANIAGVDIMHSQPPHAGPLVTEVNVFPGLRIEKVTGVNVARKVVTYAVQLYYNAHPQASADAAALPTQTA